MKKDSKVRRQRFDGVTILYVVVRNGAAKEEVSVERPGDVMEPIMPDLAAE